jgi:cytochrome c peroxidase
MSRYAALSIALLGCLLAACREQPTGPSSGSSDIAGPELDARLGSMLAERAFTGRVAETLEARLGRPVDQRLAELGRHLFFDPITSLSGDNSCSGCHGPNVSFNDSKSIAIGVDNNGVVGPGRDGPHNLRRAPTVINAAFYPKLMWDSRFSALSLDPFDNSTGFSFPEPEGLTLSGMGHLLAAQAFTPVAAREEMAGFDFQGSHSAMRDEVAARVDEIGSYRTLFADAFPDIEAGQAIGYEHIATAIAEFQITLVRADAPIDAYARGDTSALTAEQKRGAILFLGKAMCGECHIVRGYANEMFSDFDTHVLGVPQLVPSSTNAVFDGPNGDEDFGFERVSGDPEDRYEFRTSPLRNVAYQPSFMHNGAYVCLDEAIRHHMRIEETIGRYSTAQLDAALQGPRGPDQPVLARLHDLVRDPPNLTELELRQITDFVEHALADPEAHPDRLASLIPATVPSGLPIHAFDLNVPRPDCP